MTNTAFNSGARPIDWAGACNGGKDFSWLKEIRLPEPLL